MSYPSPSLLRLLHDSFREAWRLKSPLFVAHLAILLLSVAMIAPLVGLLLNVGVAFSGKPVLADLDIVWFLLSPAGLIFFLVVASVLVVAAVLEIAVMTGVLCTGRRRVFTSLRAGFQPIVMRLIPILRLALRLVVRIALIVLPFLGAGLAVAWFFLSAHDINFYLTARPPEFYIAVAMIGGILLALALILIVKLLDWALVLHLTLFAGRRVGAVFAESASLMAGRRFFLFRQIAAWLALRIAAGAVAAAIIAGFAAFVLPLIGENFRVVAAGMAVMILIAALIDAGLATLTMGMLASLLYRHYADGLAGDEPALVPKTPIDPGEGLRPRTVLVGLGLLIAAGIGAGGFVLDRVQSGDEVLVIAHRGAAAVRPENTMAAFDKAIEEGADWIELDVQETAEGEVVVFHDRDFMKLAGTPLEIRHATRADLDRIDIGSWFDPSFADQRVPSLQDVLEAARGRAPVLIELKYYGHAEELEARVVRIVEETGMAGEIAIMSLDHAAVAKVRAMRPDWRVGVLAARTLGNLASLDADFLAVEAGVVSTRLLRAAKAAGQQVYAWTVNDPMAMSHLISMGIDGLVTDEPALARKVLEQRAELGTLERLMLWFGEEIGRQLEPLPAQRELRP